MKGKYERIGMSMWMRGGENRLEDISMEEYIK